MADRITIFDTTLRDGEQSPGIALTGDQKVTTARQLAKLGVDVIEAGFPSSSDGDAAAVALIAAEVRDPIIAALARAAVPGDIVEAWNAVRHAARPRLHVFLATSDIHMEHKLRMTRDQVAAAVAEGVARARSFCSDVEFSPEDATRSDEEFMIEACRAAVEAGATTINIPDTVGFATPPGFGALIRRVVDAVGDRAVVSAHCHNDLGLAVANSLAAIENGARQVEGAINGIGERAGNTSIEEVVMALVTRADHYGVAVGVDTRQIQLTSRMVSEATGYPVQYNKAIVGRNAFAHESGIHAHGVLRERTTYEIMDPIAVGQPGSEIVLGKHSGRAAVAHVLREMQIELPAEQFEVVFARFKAVADQRGQITGNELLVFVDDCGGAGRSLRMTVPVPDGRSRPAEGRR